jgi:hypothetical protein
MAACIHYPSRKALHEANFRGIIGAVTEIIYTVSGVGTVSFTIDPSGYAANFDGVVQALEDLNLTISGVSGGGGGTQIQAGSGIFFTASGTATVINATVTSASGVNFTAGSGLYLVNGTNFNVNFNNVFQNSVSGHVFGQGSNTVSYSGNAVIISGTAGGGSASSAVTISGNPGAGYNAGSLWFDTQEGRLFVYASGNGVSDPNWYQTNAEAFAIKSEVPPSGTGLNAPPRDGTLWFNQLMGNLFIYDAVSSGWYETGSTRDAAYGVAAPAPTEQGGLWYDSGASVLRVWNGTAWI